uniref:Uncharacterized protein n=1 Tax=Brassica campestris TaxID=3711 RepID=A0A3P6AR39_BRACM|nr:unnamed protein product [Brassica rapa]
MATPSPLPPTVNLWVVLTESKRIINAHSRHLLALSLLFLLPISFSITVYPSISSLIINQSSPSHTTFSLLTSHNDIDPKTVLLLLIAYVVFVTVFNLFINRINHVQCLPRLLRKARETHLRCQIKLHLVPPSPRYSRLLQLHRLRDLTHSSARSLLVDSSDRAHRPSSM